MTVRRWWLRRRLEPPPGARVVKSGMLYGTSEGIRQSASLAENSANVWLATRTAELAEKRPVTLRFESTGLLTRLTFIRPVLGKVTGQLKPQGYVLAKRDRHSCTFTYEA